MMNTEWQMKTCYTSQTKTVAKHLAEGYEPFWGYRCTHNEKPDVKMYFRKAIVEAVELPVAEVMESEPPVVQIDLEPIREMFAGLLNDLAIDIATEMKKTDDNDFSGYTMSESGITPGVMNPGRVIHYAPDGSDKQVSISIKEDEESEESEDADNSSVPAGDGFKVVDDVPVLPRKEITGQQQQQIDRIRNTTEVNITVYPVDAEGNVRIFAGGTILNIHPNGEVIEQENPAGRDSTVV